MWVDDASPAAGSTPAVAHPDPPGHPSPTATPVPHPTAPSVATDDRVPVFGARKRAREKAAEAARLQQELQQLRAHMDHLGVLTADLEARRKALAAEVAARTAELQKSAG